MENGVQPAVSPTHTALPSPTIPLISDRDVAEVFPARTGSLSDIWKNVRLETGDLVKVAFANDGRGFLINKFGKLFRTDDGGGLWRATPLPVSGFPAGAGFAGPEIGLLALNVRRVPGAGGEAVILRTGDGGKSWAKSFSGDVTFFGMRVVDDSTAWVFGGHTIERNNTVFSEIVLLKTTDSGITWTDRAAGANQLNEETSGNGASDLMVSGGRLALYSGSRFLESVDDGVSWTVIDAIATGHVAPRFLNASDGRISLAGGSRNGRLTYFMIQDAPGKWHWIERRGFNATEVRYVSGNEVLACGTIRLRKKGVEYAYDDESAGAILYSSDSGLTWTSVYQDPEIEEFQSMAVTDNGRIFVAGGNEVVSSTLDAIRKSVENRAE